VPGDLGEPEILLDAARRESEKWQKRAERAENLASSVMTTSLTAVVLGVTGFGLAHSEDFSDNPYVDWAQPLFLVAIGVLAFALLFAAEARAPALLRRLGQRRRGFSPRLRADFEALNKLMLPSELQGEREMPIQYELLEQERELCEARHATARAQERVAGVAQGALGLAISLLGTAGICLVWPIQGLLL
jgi:hypothetical protein